MLTVGKNGQKLTPNTSGGALPGLGFQPVPGGLKLNMGNGTMEDLTGFLQVLVAGSAGGRPHWNYGKV